MSIADLSNNISVVHKHQNNCDKTVDCSCGCEDDEEHSHSYSNVNRTHQETENMRRLR